MQELVRILLHQLVIVSVFGDKMLLVLLAFFIGGLYLFWHRHLKTLMIFFLTAVSYLYSLYLKYLFMQPRPESAFDKVYSFDIYGFPSSHVLFYTTFWGFVIYLTIKYIKEEKLLLHVVRTIAIYLIIFVGASRVFLGMHYVKDVIAGYFFGGIFLALLIWLDSKIPEIIRKN
jgi:undecaprenyl-diphosphatase